MTKPLPPCPYCKTLDGQVEKIGKGKYFCNCCGKTFTVHAQEKKFPKERES